MPHIHWPVVWSSHHNFKLGDLEYLEDVVSVFVGGFASYLARRFILSIDIYYSIPSDCYYFRTFVVWIYAHDVCYFFELLLSPFFLFLVVFREVIQHGSIGEVPHFDSAFDTGSNQSTLGWVESSRCDSVGSVCLIKSKLHFTCY